MCRQPTPPAVSGLPLEISERLEKAILFARGEADGVAWLRALPRRVDAYLRRWDLTPLEVAEGGAMSCCLYCLTSLGDEAVLKIPFDATSGRLEARSLRRWARGGASPEVLATASTSGVFLMRRVRPGTTAVPRGTPRDAERFCELITRLTRPELGGMRGLKPLDDVTGMRFEWAIERFRDPGYDEQTEQQSLPRRGSRDSARPLSAPRREPSACLVLRLRRRRVPGLPADDGAASSGFTGSLRWRDLTDPLH